MSKKLKSSGKLLPSWKEIYKIGLNFILFTLLMILFFVKDMAMAIGYYKGIFSRSFFSLPNFPFQKILLFLIIFMFVIEWMGREQEFAIKNVLQKQNIFLRWGFYYLLVFLLFLFYIAPKSFIYAQF